MTVAKVIAARLIEFSSEISNLADGETTNDAVIELLSRMDVVLRTTSFEIRKISKVERLTMGWCDQLDHSYGRGGKGEEYPDGTRATCSKCRVDGYGLMPGNLVTKEEAEASWRADEWRREGLNVTALCDAFTSLAAITTTTRRKANNKPAPFEAA